MAVLIAAVLIDILHLLMKVGAKALEISAILSAHISPFAGLWNVVCEI
jgi:hypothetical protein